MTKVCWVKKKLNKKKRERLQKGIRKEREEGKGKNCFFFNTWHEIEMRKEMFLIIRGCFLLFFIFVSPALWLALNEVTQKVCKKCEWIQKRGDICKHVAGVIHFAVQWKLTQHCKARMLLRNNVSPIENNKRKYTWKNEQLYCYLVSV